MNVLIAEELYDKEYVDEVRHRLRAARGARRASSRRSGPSRSPRSRPRRSARRRGRWARRSRPSLVHPGRHVTWYGDDTQRARAMAILTALLGSWGRKGGIFLPTPVPAGDFDLPDFPDAESGGPTARARRFPLASEELGVTNGLVDATLPASPTRSRPGSSTGRTCSRASRSAARRSRRSRSWTSCASSTCCRWTRSPTRTSCCPRPPTSSATTPPLIVNSAKRPFIAVRQPVVEPLHESKPGWWIAKELAKRLGLEAFFPWATPEEHLEKIVEPMEINAMELRTKGAVAFPDEPYLEDRTEDDLPLFDTDSGKIELYSQALKDLGADPLPRYTPPDEPPAGYFRLIYGRAPVHSFARTQNNETLHGLMPENEVWLDTKPAAELGLADGDRVVLENADGVKSLPVRVRVTEGIRDDCAYLVHGFGQRSKPCAGARPRRLRHRAHDPRQGRPADGRHRNARELRPSREGRPAGEGGRGGPLRHGHGPPQVRGLPRLHGGLQRRVGRPAGYARTHVHADAARRHLPEALVEPVRRPVQPLRRTRPASIPARRARPSRARTASSAWTRPSASAAATASTPARTRPASSAPTRRSTSATSALRASPGASCRPA